MSHSQSSPRYGSIRSFPRTSSGGTQQLNSGGKPFNNLSIYAGSVVELEADVTIVGTFLNLGTLKLNGHKFL